MLLAFGHPVATCCDMLGVVGSSLKMWPNAGNMLRSTMVGYVALKCCDRLAGALALQRSLGPIFSESNMFINFVLRFRFGLIGLC